MAHSICVFFNYDQLAVRLLADGTYYVGRDDGGLNFQADQDGGWYIDIRDLRYFKIGQTGTYSIKRDFVEVGRNKKTELYAVIVDHIGPPVSHKGLLGMNFLSRLDYRIDFERRVII
jgi:hypothetical protein